MLNIDMSNLSDEDIYVRIDQAQSKITKAWNAGASHTIIAQMQSIIESYQFELYDRAARRDFDNNRKQLEAIIESDPSMVLPTDEPQQTEKPRRRVSL